MPASCAIRSAFAATASETATISAPGTPVPSTRTCVLPISPAPMTPIRTAMGQTAVGKCMWPRWCPASCASSGQRLVIALPRV